MDRLTLKIGGMSCGHCVASLTRALKSVDGLAVERVAVGEASVVIDPAVAPRERIAQAVEDAGYQVLSAE
jgi:copper chaperone CopZ